MAKTEKFEAALHHIVHSCDDQKKLGATKLNKILFYADLLSYISSGKTITGNGYIKLQYGPVPKGVHHVVEKLVMQKKIEVKKSNYYGLPKTDYNSLEKPDMSQLTKEDIVLLDSVLGHILEEHTATSISDASHDIVWQAAAMGEEIPMCAFLATKPGAITENDMSWADTVIENRAS